MKKLIAIGLTLVVMLSTVVGCAEGGEAQIADAEIVNQQQELYAKVQPLPFFDYSIPRDVMIQIYKVVTSEARSTYTIIESITGETKFHGASIGYGIPVDTQLTNPQMSIRPCAGCDRQVVEQPEPNGLFSSKNTDGTWVLFVDNNGDITPIYTEHKVTTFPFTVKKDTDGLWIRADQEPASFTIDLNK
jgi:hypothetical protein